jgi:hypothetical protein
LGEFCFNHDGATGVKLTFMTLVVGKLAKYMTDTGQGGTGLCSLKE